VSTSAGLGTGERVRSPEPREAILARAVVVLTVITVVAVHLWIAAAASVPKGPDETGVWAVAGFLSSVRPSVDMYSAPRYSPGMGALLAPFTLLLDDPSRRYRVAVSLLAALVLLFGYLVSRLVGRLGYRSTLARALAFAVACLLPAAVMAGAFTWAESLALAWFGAWLLSATVALRRTDLLKWSGVAALSGTAMLVHGRFVLLSAVWLLAVAASLVIHTRRGDLGARAALGRAVVVGLAGAVAAVAAVAVRHWVTIRVWSAPSISEETGFLSFVDEPAYWLEALLCLVGQLWYLAASTAGLAVLGAWVLARRALSGSESATARLIAAMVLTAMASVLVVGVLFLSSGVYRDLATNRYDHLVYGRYLEPVTLVLAALGLTELLRPRSGSSLVRLGLAGVAVTVALAGVVRWSRERWDLLPALDATIPGVAVLPFDRPGLDVLRWTAMSVLLTAVLVAARAVNRTALAVVAMALLLAGTLATSVMARGIHRQWDSSVLYADFPDAPPQAPRAVVAADVATAPGYQYPVFGQQYVLNAQGWDFEFSELDSAALVEDLPEDVGLLALEWDAEPPGEGWVRAAAVGPVQIWLSSQADQG
jgi:hypothetical protein